MGCNCRKNKTVQTTLGPNPTGYQVFRNNVYTGRQFTSLASAQTYASRIGGEVRSTNS